jgi:hypothetical protein
MLCVKEILVQRFARLDDGTSARWCRTASMGCGPADVAGVRTKGRLWQHCREVAVSGSVELSSRRAPFVLFDASTLERIAHAAEEGQADGVTRGNDWMVHKHQSSQ